MHIFQKMKQILNNSHFFIKKKSKKNIHKHKKHEQINKTGKVS